VLLFLFFIEFLLKKEQRCVMKYRKLFKWAGILLASGLLFYASDVLADTVSDLGGVAGQITKSFGALAQLVTAISYVAGMGFGMASILKFKAHKDNPTQIPIGTPIALLFVAAALLFLPTLFGIAGSTIFGATKNTGGVSGVSTFT
jgi:intracellular multiplication protein IcmD